MILGIALADEHIHHYHRDASWHILVACPVVAGGVSSAAAATVDAASRLAASAKAWIAASIIAVIALLLLNQALERGIVALQLFGAPSLKYLLHNLLWQNVFLFDTPLGFLMQLGWIIGFPNE